MKRKKILEKNVFEIQHCELFLHLPFLSKKDATESKLESWGEKILVDCERVSNSWTVTDSRITTRNNSKLFLNEHSVYAEKVVP